MAENETGKEKELSPITRALRHRVRLDDTNPAVTPLFQSSAFEATSPYFYTRKANPNVVEFEGVAAILEDAPHACAVSTGMAAIQCALNLLRPNDTLVVNQLIYGCSYQHFHRFAERLNLKLVLLDLGTDEGIAQMPKDTHMVFFETPTNPFLRTVSIEKIAKWRDAHAPKARIVVDNTWAGPLCQRPLKWGADVSLHSATKYFSGHSDVMGGILFTRDPALDEFFKAERFFAGAIMDPHSAWLLRRSLQTFELRTREQSRVSLEMKKFLEEQSHVGRVYFPEVDGLQMTGYPGILFFELAPKYADRYLDFRNALECFGTGTGMACVTSMVAQPFSGSHASMNDADKTAMGIGKNLVRLCFGLESPDDLRADLTRAFQRLDSTR